jgi:hypothetical protein
MISQIIELLQKHHFYGAGEFTEIAKGKNATSIFSLSPKANNSLA